MSRVHRLRAAVSECDLLTIGGKFHIPELWSIALDRRVAWRSRAEWSGAERVVVRIVVRVVVRGPRTHQMLLGSRRLLSVSSPSLSAHSSSLQLPTHRNGKKYFFECPEGCFIRLLSLIFLSVVLLREHSFSFDVKPLGRLDWLY